MQNSPENSVIKDYFIIRLPRVVLQAVGVIPTSRPALQHLLIRCECGVVLVRGCWPVLGEDWDVDLSPGT